MNRAYLYVSSGGGAALRKSLPVWILIALYEREISGGFMWKPMELGTQNYLYQLFI